MLIYSLCYHGDVYVSSHIHYHGDVCMRLYNNIYMYIYYVVIAMCACLILNYDTELHDSNCGCLICIHTYHSSCIHASIKDFQNIMKTKPAPISSHFEGTICKHTYICICTYTLHAHILYMPDREFTLIGLVERTID